MKPLLDDLIALITLPEDHYLEQDSEILDIFIEEIDEIFVNLTPRLEHWYQHLTDRDDLQNIRTNFHTLKGSGRMVGANSSAELAWSVEDLLNRMLVKVLSPTQDVILYISTVFDVYRLRLAPDFRHLRPHQIDLRPLILLGQQLQKNQNLEPIFIELFNLVDAESPDASHDDSSWHEQAHIAQLATRQHEDAEIAEETLAIFVEESLEHLASIRLFLQQNQPNSEHYNTLMRALHTLRGSSAMAGVNDVFQTSAKVEQLFKLLMKQEQLSHEHESDALADYEAFLSQYLVVLQRPYQEAQRAKLLFSFEKKWNNYGFVLDQQQAEQHDKQGMVSQLLALNIDHILDAEFEFEQRLHSEYPDYVAQLIKESQVLKQHTEHNATLAIYEYAQLLQRAYQALLDKPILIEFTEIEHQFHAVHLGLLDLFDRLAAGQRLEQLEVPESLQQLLQFVQQSPDVLTALFEQIYPAKPTNVVVPKAVPTASTPVDIAQIAARLAQDRKLIHSSAANRDFDLDLLDIFLEEADELLSGIDADLNRWAQDQQHNASLKNLMRYLHTLKGGANMVQTTHMGLIAHELETIYQRLIQQKVVMNASRIAIIRLLQDELSDRVQILREQLVDYPADNALNILRDLDGALNHISEPVLIDSVPATETKKARKTEKAKQTQKETETLDRVAINATVNSDHSNADDQKVDDQKVDDQKVDNQNINKQNVIDDATSAISTTTSTETNTVTNADAAEIVPALFSLPVADTWSFVVPELSITSSSAASDLAEEPSTTAEFTEKRTESDTATPTALHTEQQIQKDALIEHALIDADELADDSSIFAEHSVENFTENAVHDLGENIAETIVGESSLSREPVLLESVLLEPAEVNALPETIDNTGDSASEIHVLPHLVFSQDTNASLTQQLDDVQLVDVSTDADGGLTLEYASEIEHADPTTQLDREPYITAESVEVALEPIIPAESESGMNFDDELSVGYDRLQRLWQDWTEQRSQRSVLLQLQRNCQLMQRLAMQRKNHDIANLMLRLDAIFEQFSVYNFQSGFYDASIIQALDWLQNSIYQQQKPVAGLIQLLSGIQLAANVKTLDAQNNPEAVLDYVQGTHTEPPSMMGEWERSEQNEQNNEMIRVSADMIEKMIDLSGENAINRSRIEMDLGQLATTLQEMEQTIQRLADQLRRMEGELESQILAKHEHSSSRYADFDPLEMDQYSSLNQLSKSLAESASDLVDFKVTLANKIRDTESLLLQQSRIQSEIQESLMRTRLVPFSRLLPRLQRVVRQTSSTLNRPAELVVQNTEGELDRSILERLVTPLEHMLRNAVDHGLEDREQRLAANKPEMGRIELNIQRQGADVVVTFSDDGKGIDVKRVQQKAEQMGLLAAGQTLDKQDILQFIFHPGFSTATEITQISGRGVGLDVVLSDIKTLGGHVSVSSELGKGTRFIIRVPTTVAVGDALMVRVGEQQFALPLAQIDRIVRIAPSTLAQYFSSQNDQFSIDHIAYKLRYLGEFTENQPFAHLSGATHSLPVILIKGSSGQTIALLVDQLIGSRSQIVVKPVGQQFASVGVIAGATILGDGQVCLILDAQHLVRQIQASVRVKQKQNHKEPMRPTDTRHLIMIVDDSVTVRKVTSRLLERQGFEVVTAKDGIDAIEQLESIQPDLMLLDIEMPRMDGFEVTSLVRHHHLHASLPIIMITSRAGEKHRERAFSLGVNQYMGKPFQEAELLSNIQQLLTVTS